MKYPCFKNSIMMVQSSSPLRIIKMGQSMDIVVDPTKAYSFITQNEDVILEATTLNIITGIGVDTGSLNGGITGDYLTP